DNNRIVILKNDYTVLSVIDYFESAVADHDVLSKPKGVFVNDDYIYVSDTGNKRIVIFNKSDLSFYKIISRPESPLVQDKDWQPAACAVDQYGRIFVVSDTATMGVIVLADDNGYFNGYIGAQKVTYNLFELFWRKFQTEAQKAKRTKNVSVTFNNITIDEDGFIFVTTDKIEDKNKQIEAISNKKADYSPVKKLNSAGKHILQRNGFYDCGGEVYILPGEEDDPNANPSKISDVAVGPEGSWSISDINRGRVYTYTADGELLFAFGDGGDGSGSTGKLGSLTHLQSMTYQLAPNQDEDAELKTYNLVLLDSFTSLFTVFTRTDYGDLLIEALAQENHREYQNAQEYWMRILQRNGNFDAAYIGVGKALYRQGKYEEAEEYFKACYETTYYSKAYTELRKVWIGQSWHLLLIVLVVVAFLIVLVKGLGAAKKFNTRVSLKPGKKTYWEELVFPFHLVFHPFDGFWDLKHEKRGSVRGGLTIMGLTVVALYYNTIGQGYIFSPVKSQSNIVFQALAVVLPVFLFVTSNWCLTTLFDGEGSFRDVLITTCYSLAPLPPMLILSTLRSNVLTKTEGPIAGMLVTIGFIWTVFLLFFGTLVTHGYSLPKNIITTIGTIVAAAVLVFVALLFSNLVGKMIQFVANIVIEVSGRT
ncbi:MAG: YIP1 family protein, partial [Clostridia bacterium]|nr:YIP1 family protein [Clostridia bacterium]